jgi:hypothetical protein
METLQEEPTPPTEPAEGLPDAYAIVEVFGHRRIVGRVTEVERYGTKMLRIDVLLTDRPDNGDFALGYTTQYYGGSSVFSETPCDLATVKRLSPKRYAQPAIASRSPFEDDDDERDHDEGDDQ